jgi:xanthine dehydrogenase accessory factor
MINGELADRATELAQERVPFVVATVIRARRPTSVRPGFSALVRTDGTIEGFLGGQCAETSVRLHSLRALETGEPLLLRIVPGKDSGGQTSAPDGDDAIGEAVVERNPCLSGGSIEIFLEPQLPPARLVVVGSTPIADALAKISAAAGFEVVRVGGEDARPDASDAAVIVASHGGEEERVLAEALSAGVPYVALVASAVRGQAIRAALDVPDELKRKLHTPAGLAIGARTPEETAVSILAQLVSEHHAQPGRPSVTAAIDPVCSIEVAVTDETPSLDVDGQRIFFCSTGCRDSYAAQHATY